MPTRLISLEDALAPMLDGLRPAAPLRLPIESAAGLVLAEPLVAPGPLPRRSVALRAGHAVAALDLAGASPQAPVMLASELEWVRPGDELPPGADAVAEPDIIARQGAWLEASEAVAPGANARLAGHDLRAGATIAPAGGRLTPERLLAARLAGLTKAAARSPSVTLEGFEGPGREWLAARLSALGCRIGGEARPELVIRQGPAEARRLALGPGEACMALREAGVAVIEAPGRFDAIAAAWCALALPALGRLLGLAPAARAVTLSRKLASGIGASELALLRETSGLATPLALGDVTLAALAEAELFLIVPAGSEGFPAGARVDAVPLAAPFAEPVREFQP